MKGNIFLTGCGKTTLEIDIDWFPSGKVIWSGTLKSLAQSIKPLSCQCFHYVSLPILKSISIFFTYLSKYLNRQPCVYIKDKWKNFFNLNFVLDLYRKSCWNMMTIILCSVKQYVCRLIANNVELYRCFIG